MNFKPLFLLAPSVILLLVVHSLVLCVWGMAVASDSELGTESFTVSPSSYTATRTFDTENGLPANGITYGLQASNGYIWFSTFNGLVRYDGARIVTYNMSRVPELTSNRFLSVAEGRDGRIYAGLEYGTLLVVDGSQTRVHVMEEQQHGRNLSINAIYEDERGIVWLGTENGMFQMQDTTIHAAEFIEEGASRLVQMIDGCNNSVRILTADRLYEYTFETNRFEVLARHFPETGGMEYKGRFTTRSDQITGHLWQFYSTPDAIYLAHGTGAYRLSEQGIESVVFREQIGMSTLRGVIRHDDRLFVYGDTGLYELRGSDTAPAQAIHINATNTNYVFTDHEGSFWMATFANGVIQVQRTPVYRGDTYEPVSQQAITALLFDQGEELWVGTNCDGLYHFSDTQVYRYDRVQGLENSCVWSLMQQADGTLWAGTWGGGVFRMSPGQRRFHEYAPPPLEQASVMLSLYEDSRGGLWFGTYYNGLFYHDGQQIVSVLSQDGRTLGAVRMIFENGRGEMLFATDNGVGRLTPDGTVEFPEQWNILTTNNFRIIARDARGNYWFGSYGGGLVVDTGDSVHEVTAAQGLLDETVSQMQFDARGNVWLAGNQGVFFIEQAEMERFLSEETQTMRISRFGVAEGLAVRETTGGFMPSSAFYQDRWLYIPTVRGLARLDTGRFEVNRQPPAVFVDEIEIDGQVRPLAEVEHMQWDEKRMVFRFSVLSFKNPDHVQVEYRLDGFDNEWVKASGAQAREALYTNLPHGRYTMRVRGSNNDGYFGQEAYAFTFVITPPFWNTWWFYALVVVGVFTVVLGVYLTRVSRIQQANRALEEQVASRTRQLAAANRELEQLVEEKNKVQRLLGHDLRNPISSIISYLELLKSEDGLVSREEQQYMLDLLLSSSRESLNLLENLMHFSGVSNLGVKPVYKTYQVADLVEEAINVTRSQAERKHIAIELHIDGDLIVEADRVMMVSILRNLLSNAVKFSGKGNKVIVRAWKQNAQVGLSVTDHGVGMSSEIADRLFEKLTTQSRPGTGGEKGMGVGLQICKDFVEKHNGSITVESQPGEGSTFTVLLPEVQLSAETS